jgi:hypothetical protein
MKKINYAVISFWKLLYRPMFCKAAHQILEGRYFDPDAPKKGRWLQYDVRLYLKKVWKRTDEILPLANLETLPTHGSRHNVFLAAVTISAYQILIESNVPEDYAKLLFSDMGWKIYSRMTRIVSLPFRLFIKNPGKRLNLTLHTLMVFPFSAPGAPGYEAKIWTDGDNTYTYWTHCPPQTFVRSLIEKNGDHGELDAFYKSWCLYDWAAADIMANDNKHNHYTRTKTLSKGDDICDMCWYGCSLNTKK